MKLKPTGFIAICQCQKIIGAMDYVLTDRKEAGKIMGQWLADGCKVEPRFTESWAVTVEPCICNYITIEEDTQ